VTGCPPSERATGSLQSCSRQVLNTRSSLFFFPSSSPHVCACVSSSLVLSLSDVLSNTGKHHLCLNSPEVSVMSSRFLSFTTTPFPCSPPPFISPPRVVPVPKLLPCFPLHACLLLSAPGTLRQELFPARPLSGGLAVSLGEAFDLSNGYFFRLIR